MPPPSRTLRFLLIAAVSFTIFNIIYGWIFPDKFFSMFGEAAWQIELEILAAGLLIGPILGIIPYKKLPYKLRFRFWLTLIQTFYNVYFIFVNVTEYWI